VTPLEFERRYAPAWDRLERLLARLEQPQRGGAAPGDGSLARIPSLYREVCHHLALARDREYPSFLVTRLNDLVQRAHQAIYQPKTRIWSQIGRFVSAEFPSLVRANARLFAISAAAFFLPVFVLGVLVYLQPELVYSVFDPQQVAEFERMYNPAGKAIGRVRGADSDILMFGYYISHNIGISFQVFAGGVLFGVGSLFYLVINGAFIGATSGYLTQIGYGETFWSFVCGHGAFELTAIAISGMAGLKIGFAILAPGRLTRRQALVEAAKVAVKIVYGVAGMLLIAAFIEAFWSSLRWPAPEVKYSVAAMLWGAVIYYFVLQGRAAQAGAPR
jgi:uncharacterized membrane protein SpoIIM required for sporulation